MKLTKKDREILLTTFVAVLEKLLEVQATGRKRGRRTRDGVARLREIARAERRKNKPVRIIAEELGVTPAYIYQITNRQIGSTKFAA